MDKKTALITLIQHSFLLSEDKKLELLGKINTYSEERLTTLGKLLAIEKKKAIQTNQQKIERIDKLLKSLQTL